MRVVVDWNRCEGHGLCTQRAPKLFDLNDDGELIYHLDGHDVPATLQDDAQAGATVCPVAALTVVS